MQMATEIIIQVAPLSFNFWQSLTPCTVTSPFQTSNQRPEPPVSCLEPNPLMTNRSPNPKLNSPHSKLQRQLRSLDLAFNLPLVKSLGGKKRGELLVKRAELELSFNTRRRFDSTIEAILLSCGERHCTASALCLLSQCNEHMGHGLQRRVGKEEGFITAVELVPRKGLEPIVHGLLIVAYL